jgi:hypothetical protein
MNESGSQQEIRASKTREDSEGEAEESSVGRKTAVPMPGPVRVTHVRD